MSKAEKSVNSIIKFLKFIYILGIIFGFIGLLGCAAAPSVLANVDVTMVIDETSGLTIEDFLLESGITLAMLIEVMRAALIPCAAAVLSSIGCFVCFNYIGKQETPFTHGCAKVMLICGASILGLAIVSTIASSVVSPETSSFDTATLVTGAVLMFVSRLLELATEKIENKGQPDLLE